MQEKIPDLQLAEMCAAVMVNRLVGSMDANITRLVFLEAFASGSVEPRTAVCMQTSDAVALYRMLGELIAKQPSTGKAH